MIKKNLNKIIILTLLVASFILSSCAQPSIIDESTSSEVQIQQNVEEPNKTDESELPEETSQEIEETILPTRPETASIEISIEGMLEEEELQLIYNNESRISTYVPSDFLVETETFDGKEFIKTYTNNEKVAAVILYAIDGNDATSMEQIAKSYFENMGYEDISENRTYSTYEDSQTELIYGISDSSDKGEFFSHEAFAKIGFIGDKTYLLAYYCPIEYVEGLFERFNTAVEEIELC